MCCLTYLWRSGRAECTAAKESAITLARSNSSAGAATGLWMMSRIVPGDEVLYGKYAGTEVEFEGEKLLIMRQSDVLGVFEK